MQVTRRQFFRVCAAGMGSSSVVLMGFSPGNALAEVREFKLTKATETRNTCPYCSVACGVLIYSLGDKSKNAQSRIFHIEGDPDNPVNRGTLCPKGAAALDFVHSKSRVLYPMHRKPGSDKFERVSWDAALDRIAKLIKEDRDANFVEKNKDGATVNRYTTTGLLGGCAASNESGWLTYKFARSLGIVQLDNQARI